MRERALKLLLLSFTSVTTIIPSEGNSNNGNVSVSGGGSGSGSGSGSSGTILLAGGLDDKQVTAAQQHSCTHHFPL